MFSKSEIRDALINYPLKEIMEKATCEKRKIFGNRILIRGIVEFSNHCSKNCLYCGIRAANINVKRYEMKEEEIFEVVKKACELKIKTVVLQSGELKRKKILKLGKIVEKIKGSFSLAITLSLGDLTKDEYKYLKECGADRYLLKFETSDEKLFEKLRPNTSLKERIKNIYTLKDLGYEVGSGNIIGLPGSNLDTLINDLLLIKELELDMIGVGPFIPQRDTPLKDGKSPNIDITLKFLSLVRLLNPISHIPATTSFDALHPEGRILGLKSGANVVMMDITPPKYSKNYKIYNKKTEISYYKDLAEKMRKMTEMVEKSGNKLFFDIGASLKAQNPRLIF